MSLQQLSRVQAMSVTSLATTYSQDTEEGKKTEVNIGVSLADASQSSITLLNYFEENTGSLIVDPEEAKREFGESAVSLLKLSEDGTKVLWPQPSDDPNDPQNWSESKKTLHLIIITLAAFVPDFDGATGTATLFPVAQQFDTTANNINELTGSWGILLIGWGGVFAVMAMHKFGRLPVLFWSQLLALVFMILSTFSQTLGVFAAARYLNGFFGTCPQVTGLFVIADMYPFHLQARKINIWTMGYILSPFIPPFAFGFLVAHANWRWAFGIGSMYGLVILALIALFMEETMYDRKLKLQPVSTTSGFKNRIEMLIGITGARMAKYRRSWKDIVMAPFKIVWRPHFLPILVYTAAFFGFSIGVNATNAVFLGSPPPIGFGFSQTAIAGSYATPIVGLIIGEAIGRYANDWIMNWGIKRNRGVFQAEIRLWTCYVAMPFYLAGFIMLGFAIDHASIPLLIIGWGIMVLSVILATVSVFAYANDCFPRHQGEISALMNLARSLGGFSTLFFQVQWAEKVGAIEVFGVEAAIVMGLFVIVVPLIQLKGKALRVDYSV